MKIGNRSYCGELRNTSQRYDDIMPMYYVLLYAFVYYCICFFSVLAFWHFGTYY